MYAINAESFARQYQRFRDFVQLRSGQPFAGFDNPYVHREEHYKTPLREIAHSALRSDEWDVSTAGSGNMLNAVAGVVQPYVTFNGRGIANNLVNWRAGARFSEIAPTKELEEALFELFRSNNPGERVYDVLREANVTYQIAAYLFYLRDPSRFLPISQQKFEGAFKLLGVEGFRTWGERAWQNYMTFIGLVAEVRELLEAELSTTVSLLDAHSFVWIIAAQMQRPWRLAEHLDPPKEPKELFFTREEVELLATYGDQFYDPATQGEIQRQLRQTAFKKSSAWAKALEREGWKARDDIWTLKRSGPRAKFKEYSWAQVYRTGALGKRIFFTFGVDGGSRALVYKLECRDTEGGGEGEPLTEAQVEIFRTMVEGTSANWNQVGLDELKDYDWRRLLDESHRFMAENETLYDEIDAAVWTNTDDSTLPTAPFERTLDPFVFTGGTDLPPEGDEAGMRKGAHVRHEKKVQPSDKHARLSRALTAHLRTIHGKENVEFEHSTGKGTTIDVVARTPDGEFIFYEIKSYDDLRYAIREAAGQLLEYAHWARERNATQLVIVCDIAPDELTRWYMEHLRGLYGLPLYYQRFNLATGKLEECL